MILLRPFISPVTAHEPRNSPNSEVDSPDPTATRTRVVGVRVSAPLHRGAAPYGDGSLCSQAPSHFISLSILGVLGLTSLLTWHDFSYVTMAQKVQASTLVYPWYPYPSFWERAGPHIPVAQDPPSEPRAKVQQV